MGAAPDHDIEALGIEGNSAIVMASSRGLGRAAATELVRAGANVVVNGRDAEAVDVTVAALNDLGDGGRAVGRPGDLTDPETATGLVETAVAEFGGLDHLVTNAGDPPSGGFFDVDDEDWGTAFDLLVMSVVRVVREAAPHLRDGGGSVVNVTSITLAEPVPTLVLSSSVRQAVLGLAKTLSREFAPDVRVNSVLPGPTETEALSNIVADAVERGEYGTYEDGLDSYWPADIPAGRVGQPAELGRTVAFLASPAASYVNGTALLVDGGAVRALR